MKLSNLTTTDVNGQGGLEWKRARLGMFTATRIKDLMSKGRAKDDIWGEAAKTVMAEVAGERDLDQEMVGNDEQFTEWCNLQCRENQAMRHGHEWENIARCRYMLDKDVEVIELGMCTHKKHKTLAASPDGVIVDKRGIIRGAVEIKCPSTNSTYMKYRWYIKDAASLKQVKPEYYWQIQNVMNVTEAKWCDLVIYSPFHNKDMYVVRIERVEEDIQAINERVVAAEQYIKSMKHGK